MGAEAIRAAHISHLGSASEPESSRSPGLLSKMCPGLTSNIPESQYRALRRSRYSSERSHRARRTRLGCKYRIRLRSTGCPAIAPRRLCLRSNNSHRFGTTATARRTKNTRSDRRGNGQSSTGRRMSRRNWSSNRCRLHCRIGRSNTDGSLCSGSLSGETQAAEPQECRGSGGAPPAAPDIDRRSMCPQGGMGYHDQRCIEATDRRRKRPASLCP